MKITDPITTIEAARILNLDPSAIRHRISVGTLISEKRGRDHLVSLKVIQTEADAKGARPKLNSKKGKKRR